MKLNPYTADSNLLDPALTIQQVKKKGGSYPYVKLKLVITELSDTMGHRIQRSVASKLGQVNQEWGYFHTSLVFGPFYLEWTQNSIVTIRSRSSSKAVFVNDVHVFKTQESIDNAFKELASIICKWNGEMTYSSDKCNCQHFVSEVMRVLGVENKSTGSIKYYLEKLKNEGACKMEINLSEPLKKEFGCKTMKFKTHHEIDTFYVEAQRRLPTYFLSPEGVSDEMLLKAFDRAFWLRHASSQKKDDDSCLPLRDEEGECQCPFNPLEKPLDKVDNSVTGGDYYFGQYVVTKPSDRSKDQSIIM